MSCRDAEQLSGWGRGWEEPGKEQWQNSGLLRSPMYGGFSAGRHCRSPVAWTVKKEGRGVLCSGATIPGTVQEKPCSTSALSSVIRYQRASARQDQQRASTNNPVYSNVISMVRALRSFHLMSCPMIRCFSGTICHPEKEHLSRGCLLPTLPSKQGRISNKGVCPGWRMPARDGVLSQQMQAVPLGRSGVSCLFSSVSIAAGLHLTMGPPPRSAAMP